MYSVRSRVVFPVTFTAAKYNSAISPLLSPICCVNFVFHLTLKLSVFVVFICWSWVKFKILTAARIQSAFAWKNYTYYSRRHLNSIFFCKTLTKMAGPLPLLSTEAVYKKIADYYKENGEKINIKNLFESDAERFKKFR